MFVLLLHNTPVEHKTLTKNSCTISQSSPTPCNAMCTTGETGERTLHKLVEKSRTLGFQQENQDWKEKSTTFMKGSQLVLYQILHYSICPIEGNSKYKISVTTQISNSNVVI